MDSDQSDCDNIGADSSAQIKDNSSGINPDEDSVATPTKVIPPKSKEVYYKRYMDFVEWRDQRYITAAGTTEEILLAYFKSQASEVKPSSLWTRYSMMKCMLKEHENVDVTTFLKLTPYLRKISAGFNPRKTKYFTKRQIDKFMIQAPDKEYLVMKVILIFGISGGLNVNELVQLMVTDIIDQGTSLLVTVIVPKSTKQKIFTISGEYYLNLYRRYMALLPAGRATDRLFWNYANGKCRKKVIGIHQMGNIPGLIATFLNLSNSSEYTGHSFRKTSAMVHINNCEFLPPEMPQTNLINGSNLWNAAMQAEREEEESVDTKAGVTMKNCTDCFVNVYVIKSNKL